MIRKFLIIATALLWSLPVLAAPDFETLKRIPSHETAQKLLLRDIVLIALPDHSASVRERIGQWPAERRRLFWLMFLQRNLGRDGLHTFFFLDGGDFAPEVAAALQEAGLSERARLLAAGMAVFGPAYPVANETRKTFFAWSTSSTTPLTPQDHALMALQEAFGEPGGLAAEIGGYIDRTPALREWIEAERGKTTDAERLAYLTRNLTVNEDNAEARGWPEPYRRLFFLDLFNLEMLNGGVHQFFANSSGDVAPEVAAALREAALPRHAAAVEQGMRLFGDPFPRERNRREERLFPNGKAGELDRALEKLTGEVDDGKIPAAMLEIARQADILPR